MTFTSEISSAALLIYTMANQRIDWLYHRLIKYFANP